MDDDLGYESKFFVKYKNKGSGQNANTFFLLSGSYLKV